MNIQPVDREKATNACIYKLIGINQFKHIAIYAMSRSYFSKKWNSSHKDNTNSLQGIVWILVASNFCRQKFDRSLTAVTTCKGNWWRQGGSPMSRTIELTLRRFTVRPFPHIHCLLSPSKDITQLYRLPWAWFITSLTFNKSHPNKTTNSYF